MEIVAELATAVPGAAFPWRRAATLRVSPIAMVDLRSAPPILPTTAGPLWIPTRTASLRRPRERRPPTECRARRPPPDGRRRRGPLANRSGKDPVPAVALHIAPIATGHRNRLVLVGLDQVAVFLRISCRRELGRAHKVAEDHCDGAQLGPESDAHRFGQSADVFLLANGGSTRRTEAGAVGQHLRAGVAVSDHEQIDPEDSGYERGVVPLGDGGR